MSADGHVWFLETHIDGEWRDVWSGIPEKLEVQTKRARFVRASPFTADHVLRLRHCATDQVVFL